MISNNAVMTLLLHWFREVEQNNPVDEVQLAVPHTQSPELTSVPSVMEHVATKQILNPVDTVSPLVLHVITSFRFTAIVDGGKFAGK